MSKQLIVNADDCNLTLGVTEKILRCHDQGIVSSTSLIVSLPVSEHIVEEIKKRQSLGVGLHLNITIGKPTLKHSEVESLIGHDLFFKWPDDYHAKKPDPEEVCREFENQIELFKKIFGKLPTHLDTHHQLHRGPFFLKIVAELAEKYHRPLRRPFFDHEKQRALQTSNIPMTDHLFGQLDAAHYWKREALIQALNKIPEGISEIMCHPGKDDKDLRAVSSFSWGREEEAKLFASASLRKLIEKLGITLTHYGICYA